MNKKFLSAILFGALMVTSTGTFVSCKDYDDDIEAINKELTDIKSQIAALQSKVESGNYVTNITKAEGGINVTFSNGSTNFVETGAVVETEECYASAATIVDGKWVINKADGTTVETGIPASGVLVTGSEATGYVLSVVNAAGEITEVKLPTAASTLKSIEVIGGKFTGVDASSAGINWAKASKNDNWKGALGKIADKQFLVGQITSAYVSVAPVTYDLGAQELKLVDNQGNVAPVNVYASANPSGWLTSSRAASATGGWYLDVEMTADVTADNVYSAFAVDLNGDGAVDANKKYALMINGTVASDYEFVIDTYTKAESEALTALAYNASNFVLYGATPDAGSVTSGFTGCPHGKTYGVYYEDAKLADAYLSLDADNKVKADLYGVTVSGMTITVPATAANQTIKFTLNMLDVLGNATSTTFNMTFKSSTVSAGTTFAATTYTLTSDASKQYIDIKAADFFKGLSAAEVTAFANMSLSRGNQTTFLATDASITAATFHNADSDGKIVATPVTLSGIGAAIKNIAFIRIPVATANPNAKPGDYNLTLTLTDGTNEIKKATIPVTIALPKFTDLYPTSAAWDGSSYSTKLLAGKKISLKSAFNVPTTGIVYDYDDLAIAVAKVDDKAMVADGTKLDASGVFAMTSDIITDKNVLRTNTLAATATYQFYASSVVASPTNDNYKHLVVKSEFTIDLHAQFEAPKLVYYVDGVAKDVAKVGEGNKIVTLYSNDNGKQGLAIQYAKGEQAFEIAKVVDGVELLSSSGTAVDNKVTVATTIKDVTAGTAVMTATDTTNKVQGYVTVSENKGTLVATFTDANGIVTTATIAFE